MGDRFFLSLHFFIFQVFQWIYLNLLMKKKLFYRNDHWISHSASYLVLPPYANTSTPNASMLSHPGKIQGPKVMSQKPRNGKGGSGQLKPTMQRRSRWKLILVLLPDSQHFHSLIGQCLLSAYSVLDWGHTRISKANWSSSVLVCLGFNNKVPWAGQL